MPKKAPAVVRRARSPSRYKAGLGLYIPAVDVRHVGDNLEGVKADADGQHQPRPCKAGAKKGVDVFVQKAGVFKEHQEGEIQHHRRNEGAAGLPALRVLQMLFYMQGQQPVDKGGGDK